ncbi:MAG: hypothetical protein HDS08_04135 [Bacteroides sp.]|nr:hypothetical protein [Bacteroides sp.]
MNFKICIASILTYFGGVLVTQAAAVSKAAESPAAVSVEEVLRPLRDVKCFEADAVFSVTMPQLSDDVVYDLHLTSTSDADDELLPCEYLIDWKMQREAGDVGGFSAYFDGHHYRYSGERLQEYHMEWDSVPFMPRKFGITKGVGVQRGAQFVDLLPQVMYEDITALAADSLSRVWVHVDTLISGRRCDVIEIKVIVGGEVSRECEYVFDRLTGMPERVTLENSPGGIGEQTVMVSYTNVVPASDPDWNEEWLIERYPRVFEQFRQSNFRIENMRGVALPAFSLPTLTGERYSYRSGDRLRVPAIIAMLDADGGMNSTLIEGLRGAVASMPVESQIIWVFTGNNADEIESQVGQARVGESVLTSGRGLVRDCGAADLPVVMLVGKDGIVRNVFIGVNQSLFSDVIQEMSLMAQ